MPVIKLIRRRRGITHKVDCYSCVILFSWKRRSALESSVSIYKIISRNNKRSIEKRRMCEKKRKGRKEGRRKLGERNCRGNDQRESNDLG